MSSLFSYKDLLLTRCSQAEHVNRIVAVLHAEYAVPQHHLTESIPLLLVLTACYHSPGRHRGPRKSWNHVTVTAQTRVRNAWHADIQHNHLQGIPTGGKSCQHNKNNCEYLGNQALQTLPTTVFFSLQVTGDKHTMKSPEKCNLFITLSALWTKDESICLKCMNWIARMIRDSCHWFQHNFASTAARCLKKMLFSNLGIFKKVLQVSASRTYSWT